MPFSKDVLPYIPTWSWYDLFNNLKYSFLKKKTAISKKYKKSPQIFDRKKKMDRIEMTMCRFIFYTTIIMIENNDWLNWDLKRLNFSLSKKVKRQSNVKIQWEIYSYFLCWKKYSFKGTKDQI